MHKEHFKLCSIGDTLAPEAYSPPDAADGTPALIVWQPFGAKLAVDCAWLTFERVEKGAVWKRTK